MYKFDRFYYTTLDHKMGKDITFNIAGRIIHDEDGEEYLWEEPFDISYTEGYYLDNPIIQEALKYIAENDVEIEEYKDTRSSYQKAAAMHNDLKAQSLLTILYQDVEYKGNYYQANNDSITLMRDKILSLELLNDKDSVIKWINSDNNVVDLTFTDLVNIYVLAVKSREDVIMEYRTKKDDLLSCSSLEDLK